MLREATLLAAEAFLASGVTYVYEMMASEKRMTFYNLDPNPWL